MRAHSAFLAVSALAFAACLHAQEPPISQNDDIVITGTKPTKQAVARYVDRITATVENQVARFREPICPASFGLPEAYNRIIEARIRHDAAHAGLRLSGEQCDANVVLIVADDPVPLVKELRRKRPQMFVGVELSQIEDVLRTKAPVRTWQAVQPRGSDGRPLQRVRNYAGPGGTLYNIGGANGAVANAAASNSRIEQNIQPELVTSFVVISAQTLDGLTLTQVADYTAMRALASTRAPAELSGPTILALFNETAAKPAELTSWDLGYLRGVYLTDNGLAAHSQEAAISAVIRRELDKPEP